MGTRVVPPDHSTNKSTRQRVAASGPVAMAAGGMHLYRAGQQLAPERIRGTVQGCGSAELKAGAALHRIQQLGSDLLRAAVRRQLQAALLGMGGWEGHEHGSDCGHAAMHSMHGQACRSGAPRTHSCRWPRWAAGPWRGRPACCLPSEWPAAAPGTCAQWRQAEAVRTTRQHTQLHAACGPAHAHRHVCSHAARSLEAQQGRAGAGGDKAQKPRLLLRAEGGQRAPELADHRVLLPVTRRATAGRP